MDEDYGAMSVSQLMAVYEEQGDSGVPEHVQKRSCCECCDNCCRLCK